LAEINIRQKTLLDTVQKNTQRLTRLINDFLGFQKLEASKMDWNIQKNKINEYVQKAPALCCRMIPFFYIQ